MAAPSSSPSKVSLKLFIDTKSQSVVFAEADKTAVDFLFHILSLPMGAVIMFLTKEQMVGSLGNLYDSIENLSETHTQSNKNKESLLNPKGPFAPPFSSPILVLPRQYIYTCSTGDGYFSDNYSATCPICLNSMTSIMTYRVHSAKTSGVDMEVGFVKEVATYMVMDDLVVKPTSAIALMNVLEAKGLKSKYLQEKVVDIGNDQAVDLLKTSMVSKTVLTTVFLKNMSKKRTASPRSRRSVRTKVEPSRLDI